MLTPQIRARVELAELVAADTGHVIDRVRLRELGVERGVVQRLVRDRRWALLGRRCVAVRTGPLDDVGERWRAVHEVGAAALVDGVTALQAAGLRGFEPAAVHVSVHHLARAPRVPGVVVHKLARRTTDEGRLDGLPRTSPPLATVRAAHWATSDRQAALVLSMSVQQRLTTAARLSAAAGEYTGRRRRAFVAQVIADVADGAHSLGELDLGRLCRRRRLPAPQRQVVVTTSTGRCYLDARWREGVVAEIDGRQHLEGLAPVHDMLRQNEVVIGGDIVLRMPLLGLRLEPDAFLDQLARALARCDRSRHR